jgi:hypothetical protein
MLEEADEWRMKAALRIPHLKRIRRKTDLGQAKLPYRTACLAASSYGQNDRRSGSAPEFRARTPERKKESFWRRFCGIISPKRAKNGQKKAKIGQFQLLLS